VNIRVWIAIGVALLLVYTIVVSIIVGPKEENAPTNHSEILRAYVT